MQLILPISLATISYFLCWKLSFCWQQQISFSCALCGKFQTLCHCWSLRPNFLWDQIWLKLKDILTRNNLQEVFNKKIFESKATIEMLKSALSKKRPAEIKEWCPSLEHIIKFLISTAPRPTCWSPSPRWRQRPRPDWQCFPLGWRQGDMKDIQ